MTTGLTDERKRFIQEDFRQGFIAYCGYEALQVGSGLLSSRLIIREDHRQQDGFIHAGVMATMADHTAGYAAFTLVPENHRILTIEFKINFLRPAVGPALICRARVIKPGRKILICESEVYDQRPSGEIMSAKALATMASVPSADLKKS
ncbi:MAG: PaaI family thioesterase [Thermodesulfobacteriota bacterium]